jgi:hypothetical protein
MSDLIVPHGDVLFADDFTGDLWGWHHEGTGTVGIVQSETALALRLDCTGSVQGGAGCHAFCRTDFPDHIALEYDLLVRKSNGLVITFMAMRGLNGEDMLTDLPPREGLFKDYTGDDAVLRSYHTSVSRYDDRGEHTGVSNWRRNPGLHLMAQGDDLCREIGQRYAIRMVKDGGHLQLCVNGVLATEFTDPDQLCDEIPASGKIGFRAIGSEVIAEISNFRVRAIDQDHSLHRIEP